MIKEVILRQFSLFEVVMIKWWESSPIDLLQVHYIYIWFISHLLILIFYSPIQFLVINISKEALKMECFVNMIHLILDLIHEEKSSVQKLSSNSVELSEN